MFVTCSCPIDEPAFGLELRRAQAGEALLDSLQDLLSFETMLPWNRLMARATEPAEGFVRLGTDWGSRSEYCADTGQKSHDESQALAGSGRRTEPSRL